tara:strand:+ start:6796 stop:6969 length:174 start_codon:yes stop_codon:yes gene_type:complete
MSELLDRLKGNVNEAAGKARRDGDDPETRAEGAAQQIKGKAQQVKASLKAELSSDTK